MNSGFETLDYIIFAIYVVTIVGVGLYLSRGKKGVERSGEDYFLAGRNLTWWAIGASLIAANISAEHFIGMSGSGFALGLGIAAYEWMAAITLIIVGKYFLPIFLQKGIYTTNQFLAGRFNQGVSSAFAIMWLLVYIFVNLTSVTYLGALAMNEILGVEILYGIIGLAVVAGVYSVYGGLVAVAWTDVIQVIVLVIGGLVTTYMALEVISPGTVFEGFSLLYDRAAEHFDMVIQQGTREIPDSYWELDNFKSILADSTLTRPLADGTFGVMWTDTTTMQDTLLNVNLEGFILGADKTYAVEKTKDVFIDLPGIAVIVGAMWLTNLGYWGFNQYIIQKGLAAKSMNEAKQGLIFAGFLKILIPLIVVIPGIAAFVMFEDKALLAEVAERLPNIADIDSMGVIEKSDKAYPWLLKNIVPTGIRGLAFAALVAAIVSSLASMINSTSTIFTIDIYRPLINKNASEKDLVRTGRWVALGALIISTAAAQPLLGGFDQVFQYIQEYTGLIYPGVAVVFSMGLFWKKASKRAAIAAALLTFPFGIGAKLLFPEIPFLLRMGYVFIALVAVASLITFLDKTDEVSDDEEHHHDKFEGTTSQTSSVLSESVKAMMVRASYLFGAIGLASLVFCFATLSSLKDIGIEAFIFFATAMSMIGLVLYTNAKSPTADKNAIRYTPDLFKTGAVFNIGAIAITLIVAILYAIFW